jgi:RimJ/RimL family protein N-acetyltransferase
VITSGPRAMGDGVVHLREVTRADAEALYAWRMDDRSRPMFRSTARVPMDVHRAFMERYFQPENRDRWFLIEAGGRGVGTITLYGFSPDGRSAEWGRLVVDPDQRGHGYGARALALVIAHARALGVRTLRCEVLEENRVAASLYLGAGFRPTVVEEVEGRRFQQLELPLIPEDNP